MRSVIALTLVSFLAAGATAAVDQLEERAGYTVGTAEVPHPPYPWPVAPETPGAAIAEYSAFETYTFESGAEEAMESRLASFRSAGIKTLGGRVVKKDRRWSFVIEYLPRVQHAAVMPPAVIMRSYESPSAYWLEREAEAAAAEARAGMSAGGLAPLTVAVHKSGKDYAFRIDYAVKDLMRAAAAYDVEVKTLESGDYTFESDAEEAAPGLLSDMRRAGLAPVAAVPFRGADRRWRLRAEHAVRVNKGPSRPSHAISRYEPAETFTFDSGALEAARGTAGKFNAAGVKAMHHWARKTGRDYGFGLDFIVRNIYAGYTVTPSAKVLSYSSPGTFTFESEAREALAEKSARFDAEGLPVIGGRTFESGRDYSFSLDYLSIARR
ncbi:MAG: hypothetical protein FD189_1768 [Elusimicrobia bacterium]|nr:MAG: hypothetical protein FD154_1440 [Elusimicrobiota bacterium]KAF0154645.1 MAG: hypothetical protein FD189_1768 [Elusimicrobiota bacterium]